VTVLGKTPWIDRSMKTVWERVVAASPRREWAPRLLPGKKFSLEEYGCGLYGCVFPTSDPSVVCKLTSDPTEAVFIAAALSIGTFPDGIVKYYGVYRIPGEEYEGRPLFVLWREEATKIGEARSKENVAKNLYSFKAIASDVRNDLRRSKDPFAMVEESKRYEEYALSYLSNAGRGLRSLNPFGKFKGAQRVALELVYLEQLAINMGNEDELAGLIGDALNFYLSEGLLLADVHPGNTGLVEGRAGNSLVITDPGQALPLDRKWTSVKVQDLP
jgi:hypothetical protein